MIKVFLVEDEVVVRNGIKNKIDWESAGFIMVGDAGDGEMAYPMILKTQPDIIITDIKMPFLDGLSLARMVREELPWVKIIVLSGYNEFEFAKEAIQIGITDYLVKPVIKEKMLEVMQKAALVVEAEREQRANMEQYKKDMEEVYFLKRQRYFATLLSGNEPLNAVIRKGREMGIDIVAGTYAAFIFSFSRKDLSDEAYHESSVHVQEQIQRLTESKQDILLFSRSLIGWSFLIKGNDEPSVLQCARTYLEQMVAIVAQYDRLYYFAGVGGMVHRLSELSKTFDEAQKAHSYRYILEPNQIVYADALTQAPLRHGACSSNAFTDIEIHHLNRSAIERYLQTGASEEADAFIEDYCINIGSRCMQSYLIRQYIGFDVFLCAKLFLDYLSCPSDRCTEICGTLESLENMLSEPDVAMKKLGCMLRSAVTYREMAAQKKYDRLLQKAKDYIDKNYGSTEISLNKTAAHVNISASHFSTIFSQETGKTFTEYLTGVRIANAKRLLKCTQKLKGEIGYLVGYKDSHYFSYIFKKMTGTTPSEYRASKAGDWA